jgi:hypothetical protein
MYDDDVRDSIDVVDRSLDYCQRYSYYSMRVHRHSTNLRDSIVEYCPMDNDEIVDDVDDFDVDDVDVDDDDDDDDDDCACD